MAKSTGPQVKFSLNVQVTDSEVSVQCSFPGGQVSGSGQLDIVGPLILKAIEEGQKAVGKGGGK